MTTEYDAIDTMTDNMIERMTFDFENNQLKTDPDEIISNEINEYMIHHMIYDADIRTLWIDLNCPEPDEMRESISKSILDAIEEALRESERVRTKLWDSLDDWANTRIAELQIADSADNDPLDEKLAAIAYHES